ncbi:methyltransferase family protein [Methanococcoides sp.]|uniref:methyltransferase family protein n=1 Tax=Methanococcoides sp. TaxID=1966350 RepID=UPI00272E89A9|nr:methyltransferase dimerization domain-containing protein [Methanococcoides sp.]
MSLGIELMKRPEVGPEKFMRIVEDSMKGFRNYKVLATAVELNVFEHTKVPLTPQELANKIGCNRKMITLLCDVLCGFELLYKEGDSYVNTGISNTYILSDSPYSQLNFLSDMDSNVKLWEKLQDIIKDGPRIVEKEEFFGDRVIHSMAENAKCGMLQEVIQTVIENIDFNNASKMLDLGGGHGLYSIGFSSLNKDLKAFVFDLPQVVEQTKIYVQKYGANRVDVIPGNFFTDDIGGGYDLVFSSLNPGGRVPGLIPKIVSALNKGGVFVNRQVPDENSISDPLLTLDWNLWTFKDIKKANSRYSFENSISFNDYIDALKVNGLNVFKEICLKDGSMIVFSKKT